MSYDDNHYTTNAFIYIYICVCVCVLYIFVSIFCYNHKIGRSFVINFANYFSNYQKSTKFYLKRTIFFFHNRCLKNES